MKRFEIGQRVVTQHGGGVIDNAERCDDRPAGYEPRLVHTGRYGVKLDNNPLVGLKDGIAYYWPKEMEAEQS